MRFAGIDVGAERHMVAMVGEQGEVLCRSSPFGEDASGYAHLFELLGPPEGCLLALEATGHYWRNLFVALLAKGYAVAVLNPLRTRRFAEEELQRTKTDAIDALGIARFAAQKRPPAAQLPDSATEELRELARLRGDAQAIDRGLERGDSSQTLRAALAWSVGAPRRCDVQGLMNSTKASEFYPERPSAQLMCFRDFEVRNVGTSSLR